MTVIKQRSRFTASQRMTKTLLLFSLIALMVLAEAANEKPKPRHMCRRPVARQRKSLEADVCSSKECQEAAKIIKESLDESVNPCDDFYHFACGTFIKNTPIPPDQSTLTRFSILEDDIQSQLRDIVNEESKAGELKTITMVKNFNKACLNKTIIEQRGKAPLLDLLNEYGGWPVVSGDKWQDAKWNWLDVLKRFRKAGLDYDILFTFSVSKDYKNSTLRLIDIDQTGTLLGRELLIRGLEEKFVKAYYDFMVNVAVILGADKQRAETELLDALNFEIALANISWPKEERRDATKLYNIMTIKEVQEKYPYLPWLEYINAMLPESVQVDETERINVDVPSFFEKLGDVINGASKRTLANYFMWREVLTVSGTLTNELFKEKIAFYTAISGQQTELPRWKECTLFTLENLPIAVGALYARKYFTEEARQTALELVGNIREEFTDVLHKLTWMDNTTKAAALEKAKVITNHIGYPDELGDDKKIEEFFKDLEIEPDNLMGNTLKLNRFSSDLAFSKLRELVNKTDWTTHSRIATVRAVYSPTENSIQFSAAILQGKFFTPGRPHYMNYGAIGQIIGHEITHGFDDQGRQFDLDGNLAEWWDASTKEKFLEKAKCIIDQYAAYREPSTNLTLNGINTQGENIADNGGLKEAYQAYKKWAAKNGSEKKLPGLKYTPQQLFWISAAQTWCSVARPEFTKLKITSGVHSPNDYRVLGPTSNRPEFAADFKCAEGSNMNPTKKCAVW